MLPAVRVSSESLGAAAAGHESVWWCVYGVCNGGC
jgi:hypothetical protein